MRILILFALAAALVLSACSTDSGTSREELLRLAGAQAEMTAQPAPTPLPTIASMPAAMPTTAIDVAAAQRVLAESVTPVIVEVPVVVTATPAPMPTVTPDVAGFDAPAIDESAQPCPARFWRAGRCTATPAQIAQASEVTP